MKKAPLLLLLIAFCSFAQKNQHFKADIDFGGGTVFSTFLDVADDNKSVTITSPKNADVRIMGGKAKLGRVLGKSPKGGVIVTISAKRVKDSLFGQTKIPMVGALSFKGAFNGDTISGTFFQDTSATGTLRGVKSVESKINYAHLFPQVMQLISDHIYARSVLETKEWKTVRGKLEKLFTNAHDDIELFLGFNILTQNLPFSHLSLMLTKDDEAEPDGPQGDKSVIFEPKDAHTAYLQIKNFSRSKDELHAILPTIVGNPSYKNLIIDLRKNGGGGVEAAFALAQYIVTEDIEVGYFVTNKLQYSGFQPDLFKTLPAVQPKSTNAFGDELRASRGVKLIFSKPSNAVFKGNIYVLTNKGTGSTCEPIVYALKKNKMATIVGETTYGGMLAASPYVASGKYTVMVPIADFYTADGVRLDKVGVKPDVETDPEKALEKTLELIANPQK